MDDERDLIVSASKNNKDSFEKLIIIYQNRLYGFTYNIIRNEEAALDVVQESFIKAFYNLKKKNY